MGDGLTALMAAARAGRLKVVQRLLEIASPDLNAVDGEGRTALDHAAEAQREEVVNYMTLSTDLVPFGRGLLPAISRCDVQVVRDILTCTDERLRRDANQRDA